MFLKYNCSFHSFCDQTKAKIIEYFTWDKKLKTFKILIEKYCLIDNNSTSKYNLYLGEDNVLSMTAKEGQIKILEYLFATYPETNKYVDQKCNTFTPLLFACIYDQIDCVKFFLNKGSDIMVTIMKAYARSQNLVYKNHTFVTEEIKEKVIKILHKIISENLKNDSKNVEMTEKNIKQFSKIKKIHIFNSIDTSKEYKANFTYNEATDISDFNSFFSEWKKSKTLQNNLKLPIVELKRNNFNYGLGVRSFMINEYANFLLRGDNLLVTNLDCGIQNMYLPFYETISPSITESYQYLGWFIGLVYLHSPISINLAKVILKYISDEPTDLYDFLSPQVKKQFDAMTTYTNEEFEAVNLNFVVRDINGETKKWQDYEIVHNGNNIPVNKDNFEMYKNCLYKFYLTGGVRSLILRNIRYGFYQVVNCKLMTSDFLQIMINNANNPIDFMDWIKYTEITNLNTFTNIVSSNENTDSDSDSNSQNLYHSLLQHQSQVGFDFFDFQQEINVGENLPLEFELNLDIEPQMNNYDSNELQLVDQNNKKSIDKFDLTKLIKNNNCYFKKNYKPDQAIPETIIWFFEIVQNMSCVEQNKLITFITGIQWLPLGGFKKMYDKNASIMINFLSNSIDRVPTASICFWKIELSTYKNKETMQKLLNLAINDCNDLEFV